jgi:hypothetical protein
MGDVEIDAMSAVATALADLDEDAQNRVLRWAAERYGVTVGGSRGGGGSRGRVDRGHNTTNGGQTGDVGHRGEGEDAPAFEHFAELFAAVQPKTNDDKALVAAYWVQEIQGQAQWQSRQLTTELKNLGHPIPNITDALSSNMRKKPQRVIQLRKSGNSRQANKTYKVTYEGLAHVRGMLTQGGD